MPSSPTRYSFLLTWLTQITKGRIQDSTGMQSNVNNELLMVIFCPGGGGGGGYSEDILVGVCPGTKKRGVLGAGTAQKGGLRCGHSPKRVCYVRAQSKKGGLGAVTTRKKEFRTGFVKREGVRNWSCSNGGIGSLFIYYLYHYLSTWATGGVCSGWLKRWVLGPGTARKRGVLGAGPTRKKGGS